VAYNSGAMKDADRVRSVVSLWLQRPPDRQTENDVLVFYGDLERNRPELLGHRGGDPYQHLMADLRDHIRKP
jgi:hypothetical protein